MHIAICLWGICRSSQHTVESWRKNILEPLRALGHTFDVFLHTFRYEGDYVNVRARETRCRLDNELWRLFEPTDWRIENQADVDALLDLPKYRSQPDPWQLNYNSTFDNHIRALWSLREVTCLWSSKPAGTYSAILYCRPDVRYLTPLQASWLTPEALATAQLPDFAKWPINDRFCLANPDIAHTYGMRFQFAHAYSLQRPLHSETFLAYVLARRGIPVTNIPFYFKRIRVDGADFDAGVTDKGEVVRGGRSATVR
jgi:hypothetical protein